MVNEIFSRYVIISRRSEFFQYNAIGHEKIPEIYIPIKIELVDC